MSRWALVLTLLFLAGFSLGTSLHPWHEGWVGEREGGSDVLSVLFGDSRRLFARHVYAKADAYFHRGYYPSIFDGQPEHDTLHVATGSGGGGEEHEDEARSFLGQPRDWIDRFGRYFYPSEHSHLEGEGGHDDHEGEEEGHDGHGGGKGGGEAEKEGGVRGTEREILPWLRLAAELDPERPETYAVVSFWLRSEMGKPDEAEQFLREGLRTNPGNPELLFELGRIHRENRRNPGRARNLWELALKRFEEQAESEQEGKLLLHAQILGQLTSLEEEDQRYEAAIGYLERLKRISPSPARIQDWIDELKVKGRGSSYLNLSLDGLFAAGWTTAEEVEDLQLGGHDPNQRGFSVQNVEAVFDGAVDPYFRAQANVVLQIDGGGETVVELEEAYAETVALPWNLQLRAGQYFSEFGRLNPTHPHTWAFVDQPLVLGRFLGPDGLRNPGGRVSWLAPTPFYSELYLSVQDSQGETAESFRSDHEGEVFLGRLQEPGRVKSFGDLLFVPRYAASFELSEEQTLLVGVSGAFGPNGAGSSKDTQIYGVDGFWKWKPTDHFSPYQGFVPPGGLHPWLLTGAPFGAGGNIRCSTACPELVEGFDVWSKSAPRRQGCRRSCV